MAMDRWIGEQQSRFFFLVFGYGSLNIADKQVTIGNTISEMGECNCKFHTEPANCIQRSGIADEIQVVGVLHKFMCFSAKVLLVGHEARRFSIFVIKADDFGSQELESHVGMAGLHNRLTTGIFID